MVKDKLINGITHKDIECGYTSNDAGLMLSHLNDHEIDSNPVSRIYAEAMKRVSDGLCS